MTGDKPRYRDETDSKHAEISLHLLPPLRIVRRRIMGEIVITLLEQCHHDQIIIIRNIITTIMVVMVIPSPPSLSSSSGRLSHPPRGGARPNGDVDHALLGNSHILIEFLCFS